MLISQGKTMTPAQETIYDESKILTLSSLEHIRLRPGMYIGRLGNGSHPSDGIYVLLKEIVDNSIDEFIMGFGKRIDIRIESGVVNIRDFGRGIPLGKVVECVSIINTGAKYNDEVFQFSVGLNGVGTKAVNALSEHFEVTSFRDKKFLAAKFRSGELETAPEENETNESNGTKIRFIPDTKLFPNYSYDLGTIRKQLWNYAYLNRKLTITLNGEKFKSENGLLDLMQEEVGDANLYEIVHCQTGHLEMAFTHTERYGEEYFSYVNGHHTNDGGTHLSAFREGILKGVNQFFNSSFDGPDIRDGIVGVVAIKVQDPVFESQTKNKLGNSDLRSSLMPLVRDTFVDYLYKHPEVAEPLKLKIQSNERIRKELSSVKKAARDNAKKSALTIPNLKDCKFHLGDKNGRGDDSTVFITEGISAGGSMISARDVYTQAVFCLKGKPLNCHGQGKEAIYKNIELYNVMKALGIEDSLDDLRYNKVVIATDADVDGLHIRNLMLTFFLQFYEQLVLQGHIYILETPLFRVRNQKMTRYCYNESERDEAFESMRKGTHLEVTRFKGLGEISPKEFGQFIGENMRAVPVGVEHTHEIPELLNFY
ncbi:MAG TPA: type IIA DNA topoisomerase subunit B, partial [Candidatus Lambdaproteobacteria bacterium]|nr:type IIA DNA topoisomerase subunit B [Candidatus Lambdaproteobacteria bacterium]